MARCRYTRTQDHLRVGVFSGENLKIFQNFTKNLKTMQNNAKQLKLFQNFVKELCLVVGHTWIVFFFYSFNTMYIYILYTLNIHILCTFSGVLFTFSGVYAQTLYYYTLYTGLFTPKFYAENRLLAKPHIYTSFSFI